MKLSDIISPNQIFAILSKGAEGGKIIFLNILIARYLGAEELGIYAYIVGLISLIAVIAEFRIQNVLVKELVIIDEVKKGTLLGSALLTSTIFALLGVLIVIIYSLGIESNTQIMTGLLIASTMYIAKIPRIFRALFISLEKNKLIMMAEFISTVLILSMSVCVIFFSKSILYLLFVKVLDFIIIASVLIFFFIKLNIKLSVEIDKVKMLITKSAPLVISAAAMVIFQRIDIIMIKNYLGNEMAGFYSASTNYMMVFSLLPMVLSESLAPKLFSRINKGNSQKIKEKYVSVIVFVGGVMSFLMYLSSHIAIPALYGLGFEESISSALILSICPLFISLGCSVGQIIVYDNKQNKAFVKSIIACLVNIVLNFTLIPIFGINGAAFATVVGFATANFISHFLITDFKYLFKMQLRILTFKKLKI